MIRVLHILNGFSSGGAESLILNLYEYIDREKVQFDFLLRTGINDQKKLEQIKAFGGNVYIAPSFPRHTIANYLYCCNFFKLHKEYEIIHVHANSLLYIIPFIVAKKYNIKHRILHSHNTKSVNIITTLIHKIHRQFVATLATDFYACGINAGEWMFKKQKCIYINNAIDSNKYEFNELIRKEYRHSLGLEKNKVIGHIGRFTAQKNHYFLLKIFHRLIKYDESFRLLLIGDGELFQEIQNMVMEMNLTNYVIFLGTRDDVSNLLQAIDLVLFPSLYEGLPFTIIESQASGTPCIVSDNIDKNVSITDLLEFVSLQVPIEHWCELILNTELCKYSYKDVIVKAQYDIKESAEILTANYIRMCDV